MSGTMTLIAPIQFEQYWFQRGYFERRLQEAANLTVGGMLTETYANADPREAGLYAIDISVKW